MMDDLGKNLGELFFRVHPRPCEGNPAPVSVVFPPEKKAINARKGGRWGGDWGGEDQKRNFKKPQNISTYLKRVFWGKNPAFVELTPIFFWHCGKLKNLNFGLDGKHGFPKNSMKVFFGGLGGVCSPRKSLKEKNPPCFLVEAHLESPGVVDGALIFGRIFDIWDPKSIQPRGLAIVGLFNPGKNQKGDSPGKRGLTRDILFPGFSREKGEYINWVVHQHLKKLSGVILKCV